MRDQNDDLTSRIINHPMTIALLADRFVRSWREGTLSDGIFADPDANSAIVAATIAVADDEERARWIRFVRGDGTDSHRRALAEACAARPFSCRAF